MDGRAGGRESGEPVSLGIAKPAGAGSSSQSVSHPLSLTRSRSLHSILEMTVNTYVA